MQRPPPPPRRRHCRCQVCAQGTLQVRRHAVAAALVAEEAERVQHHQRHSSSQLKQTLKLCCPVGAAEEAPKEEGAGIAYSSAQRRYLNPHPRPCR